MKNPILYRIHPESRALQSVREVNFSDHNFKERYDIQEWVEESPSILGEKLLIIAKEKAFFVGTNERPDLIAIDQAGNIVIIELKRDDTGSDVHWQAIKYASYWSRFSAHKVLEVYADYLAKYRQNRRAEGNDKESGEISIEYAEQEIIDFINEDRIENLNKRQRIILVSHRFSNEVISAVDWLYEKYELDIRCIQLIPYFDEDKSTFYLHSNLILPVVGIDEYLVKPYSDNNSRAHNSRGSRNDDEVTRFFAAFIKALEDNSDINKEGKPTRHSRWAGSDYRFRYYHLWYRQGLWDNWQLSYKIRRYNDYKTNGDNRGKTSIFLYINKKYLLQSGLTERKLHDLSKELIKICKEDKSLNFNDNSDSFDVTAFLITSVLDDSYKSEIINCIIKLINATYCCVQKAINLIDSEINNIDEDVQSFSDDSNCSLPYT